MMPLYQQAAFQQVAGSSLRPGGIALTARALSLAAFAPGMRIVDVGCGPGASLSFLEERGFRAVGVDISPEMLTTARLRAPAAHLALGSAAELPLESASMDGVLCECVLSLLPAPQAALKEYYRVLKTGGKLVWADMCLPAEPDTAPDHVRTDGREGVGQACLQGARSQESMRQSLEQAGFAVLHQEECRRAVVELAAQMLWQHVDCACSADSAGFTKRASYVFFIAQKVEE